MTDKKRIASSSRVRDAVESDLPEVVRVHQIAFKGFFLDSMGPRFLRAYYGAILEYGPAIFLVSIDENDELDGFAVGFQDPEAFYDHFRSRRLRLLPIIVLALLRRPTLFVEIARNTRRVAATGKGPASVVELSSIATSRLGTGIGSHLLQAFCDRGRGLGASEVTLTTDRDENASVVNFYLRHGFEKRGIELRGARVMQVMALDLSTDDR
jgi:ribosomal protein S18 acetylase RimI-like enzyme|tara:strand:+ start:553 stop:1185 length:633 start_codon:yes stop_codon:yes gene_type:complete